MLLNPVWVSFDLTYSSISHSRSILLKARFLLALPPTSLVLSLPLRQSEHGLEENFQTQSISEGSKLIQNKEQR